MAQINYTIGENIIGAHFFFVLLVYQIVNLFNIEITILDFSLALNPFASFLLVLYISSLNLFCIAPHIVIVLDYKKSNQEKKLKKC